MRTLLAATAVVGLVGSALLTGAGAAGAVPDTDAATVRLAGPVSPAAPDADTVQTLTIPLTVTNTGSGPLFDVAISSLRSAPITTSAGLATAFDGAAVEESDATKPGPRQSLPDPLAPGKSVRVDYVLDTSNDPGTGICLCFLGVYALDVLVTAADEQGGETATVARTQTYLPSLLGVQAPVGVGWLWPLLDRPHRFAPGSVFTDDDLAASVGAGGRLDRALQVVEDVDAAQVTHPGISKSLLLLLDPDLLDELVTMTQGYTVQAAGGSSTTGTGGPAAAAWLARLAAVLPRHDVRTTPPADPDVIGLAARGVAVQTAPDAATTARIATALRLPGGRLPPHDLTWPVEANLADGNVAALTASGATALVTTADTDDDGAVAALGAGSGGATAALLADPLLAEQADSAVTLGQDTSDALQRLVVAAAMTSVQHEDDSRFVFVVPDRQLDVAPADATRAIVATTSLGRPVSPIAALTDSGTGTVRSDLVAARPSPPPDPLGAALDAAAAATSAATTIRAAVVSGADGVIGDLAARIQRTTSNAWVADGAQAGRFTADLTTRTTALTGAVRVVVQSSGRYSLASADAPLLLTVANDLPVAVAIRADVRAFGRSNGFTARPTETTTVPARSRQTVRVPTSVTRSGRFDVAVTLRTADGAPLGPATPITITSTAVGTVGKFVTYGAGALLVLALLVRGVRRLQARSRAGSAGTGPDDDTSRPDGTRPEGQPTVPASPT